MNSKIMIAVAATIFGCNGYGEEPEAPSSKADNGTGGAAGAAGEVNAGGAVNAGGQTSGTGGGNESDGGVAPPDGNVPPPPPPPNGDAGSSGTCVPGAAVKCACKGGYWGAQSCNTDGKSYGNCDCGSSGTGGSSGSGGSTSAGGSANTGGASGSSPSGGGSSATGGSSGNSTGGTTSGSGSVCLCVPNHQVFCACAGPDLGIQKCEKSCVEYTTCECPSPSNGGAGGSSGSSGTGGSVSTGGTGGTSGSGGSTSTGGAGGSSATGGSSGTGGSGGATSGTVKTLDINFYAPESMPNFSFAHKSSTDYFSGQACSGSGSSRTCSITVDRSVRWDFWASTGLSGALSWTPGWNGSKCLAELGVTVKENGADVPFRLEKAAEGCHFVLDPEGVSPPDLNDKDGDGVANASDCAPENPSIMPGATEICGNELDEDCSSNTVCGGSGSVKKTVVFQVFGGSYWSSPLKFYSYSPAWSEVTCSSVQRTDPEDGQLKGATECMVSVDRSQNLEFQVQVASQWLTGYSTPGNCQKYLRAYAYEKDSNGNLFAVADYDDNAYTFPDPQFSGKHMWHEYANNTCHVFLPKAP